MTGLLWLVLVIVDAALIAGFVNAAIGGVVGLILAVLVFLFVARRRRSAIAVGRREMWNTPPHDRYSNSSDLH